MIEIAAVEKVIEAAKNDLESHADPGADEEDEWDALSELIADESLAAQIPNKVHNATKPGLAAIFEHNYNNRVRLSP